MKNFLFATAAAIALFAAPAFACATKPISGTNAFQKVDPNCQFASDNQGGSTLLLLGSAQVDDDNDPSTPNVTKSAVKTGITDPSRAVVILD